MLESVAAARLASLTSTQDIHAKVGYGPGAVDWFAERVANYGPPNIIAINYAQSRRLRDLFCRICGCRRWTAVRTTCPADKPGLDKIRVRQIAALCPFWSTHVINDQAEVILSIRGACWERGHAIYPPTLLLVPTVWANSDLGLTCSDAARAIKGWNEAWAIRPQCSVGWVRPWD